MKPIIDPETIKKNAYLPVKLSELAKKNPVVALQLLQDWGEGKKTIKQLWNEVTLELESAATLAS
ncbi:hypothetical protein [Cytobacillus praedii]|uniref:hypothetical protein n=1 Tax=Cytobacillus praedii TaxID=1742358 RepID=UPI002E24CE79|nr:hypothetical protein [Cytobacillus praedii]